jgi:PBP1b-binding outer membrane lipoprotein LpoB
MRTLYSVLVISALFLAGCSSGEGLKSDETIGSDLQKAQSEAGEKKPGKGRIIKANVDPGESANK